MDTCDALSRGAGVLESTCFVAVGLPDVEISCELTISRELLPYDANLGAA